MHRVGSSWHVWKYTLCKASKSPIVMDDSLRLFQWMDQAQHLLSGFAVAQVDRVGSSVSDGGFWVLGSKNGMRPP
jgi:hypothetical protein